MKARKIIFTILGVLFIISGIGMISTSGVGSAVVGVVIGLVFLYFAFKDKFRKKSLTDPEQAHANNIIEVEKLPDNYVDTFSFKVTGCRYECRFCESSYIPMRQDIISKCGRNDTVTPRIYEWEGKPAVALICDRLGYDIGVVPKTLVDKVISLSDKYTLRGVIDGFEYDNKDNAYPTVQLRCYET